MPLPRAQGGDFVTLSPDVWNALVDEVERLGRMSVAAPLQMSSDGTGVCISIKPAFDKAFIVEIISACSGGALYNGSYFGTAPTISSTTNPVPTTYLSTMGTGTSCIVLNWSEFFRGITTSTPITSHYLGNGTMTWGMLTNISDSVTGKPVVIVDTMNNVVAGT